jgi:hypothetical protein
MLARSGDCAGGCGSSWTGSGGAMPVGAAAAAGFADPAEAPGDAELESGSGLESRVLGGMVRTCVLRVSWTVTFPVGHRRKSKLNSEALEPARPRSPRGRRAEAESAQRADRSMESVVVRRSGFRVRHRAACAAVGAAGRSDAQAVAAPAACPAHGRGMCAVPRRDSKQERSHTAGYGLRSTGCRKIRAATRGARGRLTVTTPSGPIGRRWPTDSRWQSTVAVGRWS